MGFYNRCMYGRTSKLRGHRTREKLNRAHDHHIEQKHGGLPAFYLVRILRSPANATISRAFNTGRACNTITPIILFLFPARDSSMHLKLAAEDVAQRMNSMGKLRSLVSS